MGRAMGSETDAHKSSSARSSPGSPTYDVARSYSAPGGQSMLVRAFSGLDGDPSMTASAHGAVTVKEVHAFIDKAVETENQLRSRLSGLEASCMKLVAQAQRLKDLH